MSAVSPKGQQAVASLIKSVSQHLYRQFPYHEPRLKALLNKRFENPVKIVSHFQEEKFIFKPALPQDEVVSIFEKTHQLSLLPGLSFDKETELYLEQQLEDVLGFSLNNTLNSLSLPFTKGTVESLAHIYPSPTIRADDITDVPEAGLNPKRPFFGWHITHTQQDEPDNPPSKYWISLPIRQWVSDANSLAAIKQWVYKRKMILINPTEAVFSVVEVLDEYTPLSSKFQFGASPAVIREGMFWSPQNLGKVIVFFLSDSSRVPKPGIYSLF